MKKKSTLSVFLLIIVVILLALCLLALLNKKSEKNKPEVSTPENSEIINQQTVETTPTNSTSTITTDPNDPNVSIYTSYDLGIQFSYRNKGEYSIKTPTEIGDKITLDESTYFRVFKKSKEESVDQALKRIFPNIFKNENCSVVANKENKYLIWDNRLPVSYWDPNGLILDSTPYQDYKNICGTEGMNSNFLIDPKFPDKIYYIEQSTQAPGAWFDSLHLIN